MSHDDVLYMKKCHIIVRVFEVISPVKKSITIAHVCQMMKLLSWLSNSFRYFKDVKTACIRKSWFPTRFVAKRAIQPCRDTLTNCDVQFLQKQ